MSAHQGSETVTFGDDSAERPLGRSIMRGMANRCPACGSGRLFRAWLKPVDACAACGEEMHHHRSDDLPPYISIVIIGHIAVGNHADQIRLVPQPPEQPIHQIEPILGAVQDNVLRQFDESGGHGKFPPSPLIRIFTGLRGWGHVEQAALSR